MRIFLNTKPDIDSAKGVAAALGTFDGLHLGHLALIRELKNKAEEQGLHSLVYTFTSVPSELFTKKKMPARLFTLEEKIQAFENVGIDYLVLMDFDKQYAAMPEDEFIRRLKDELHMRRLVVGFNITYGKNATGNAKRLKQEGIKYGFAVDVIEPVLVEGRPVSSSRIREAVARGEMQQAAALLGRCYSVTGPVVEGKRVGRTIGFPTINLHTEPEKLLPSNGVYAGCAHIGGRVLPGVTNVGLNPTFADGRMHVETHLFGFDEGLYGEQVTLEFVRKIRNEIKFESKEMLKAQIEKDIVEAKKILEI